MPKFPASDIAILNREVQKRRARHRLADAPRTAVKHKILRSHEELMAELAKNGELISEVICEEERDVIITTSDNSYYVK